MGVLIYLYRYIYIYAYDAYVRLKTQFYDLEGGGSLGCDEAFATDSD